MKKRVISIVLVLVLMLTLAPVAFTTGTVFPLGANNAGCDVKDKAAIAPRATTITNKFVIGDVDYDGKRSNADLVSIARYIVGAKEFTDDQLFYGDLDGDKLVSNADLVCLARVIVGAQEVQDTIPAIFVNSVTASPKDTEVEVVVSVINNPGILGMTLAISYDEDAMTLVDAKNGDAVSDVLTLTKAKVLKNGCKFVWDGQEISPQEIKDGTLLTLTFDISDSTADGVYKIGFSYEEGDIIDDDLLPLSIRVKNGNITIS